MIEFIVGAYGGFDNLAAKALCAAKQKHPHIVLTLLWPYIPTERAAKVPEGFDGTLYPSGLETVPRRFAIVRGNRAMIDQADYIIAFAWHPASNARNLLEYAQRREKRGELTITLLTDIPPIG